MKKTVGKNAMEADLGPVDVGKYNNSNMLFKLELTTQHFAKHRKGIWCVRKAQHCLYKTDYSSLHSHHGQGLTFLLYWALCWVLRLERRISQSREGD